jgi:hypothetical protein
MKSCLSFLNLWAVCLLLCSRAPAGTILPSLPAEVNINRDAGCHSLLFVTVRLDNGRELPFLVDTGCPVTMFDKSLAGELGKRLDTAIIHMQGGPQEGGIYAAPKLYLGKTLLLTGSNVWTCDFKWLSWLMGRRFMGVLGVDCLSNYCIQLDFQAGKMRFLDPGHLNAGNFGKAFPLVWSAVPGDSIFPSIYHSGLLGGTNDVVYIDVGDDSDGEAKQGMIKGHYFFRALNFLTTTIIGAPVTVPVNRCDWDGETYTNLGVIPARINRIGLNFLARHMVTFDFPGQKLYLKQISIGPRVNRLRVHLHGPARFAAQRLLTLEDNGQLPGWSRDDNGIVKLASYSSFLPEFREMKEGAYLKAMAAARLKSVTVNFQKDGDATGYHYIVSRASPDGDWKLEQAWQTDAAGRIVREYPVM